VSKLQPISVGLASVCYSSQTCIFHIFVSSSSDKRVPRKSTIFLILSQYCTWSMLP